MARRVTGNKKYDQKFIAALKALEHVESGLTAMGHSIIDNLGHIEIERALGVFERLAPVLRTYQRIRAEQGMNRRGKKKFGQVLPAKKHMRRL